MNTLGMIVDLAHCDERAFWQALELTRDPVIVSHTGLRHFVPWEICLSDDQLRALARNSGVVGIILSALWLRRRGLAACDDLVRNIRYACDLVGPDHVAIGSDMNGTPALRDVPSARELPRVAEGLSGAGLSDGDIARVMGGSFLRVFRQVVRRGGTR